MLCPFHMVRLRPHLLRSLDALARFHLLHLTPSILQSDQFHKCHSTDFQLDPLLTVNTRQWTCLIHVLLFSFQATRTPGLPNLLPSDNLKIWQAAAGLEQTSWLECHGAGSALCQCPMCYVPKCFVPYASVLCAMYPSGIGYACALCHPSPTLQGGRNCEPRKNQVWNCQVVERCATKTQIHIHIHTSIQTHIGLIAQIQTSSLQVQFWATEVWRSKVVPRAVSFRSNPVMSGKILPKSQKPRKTHFRTHNILAFRCPSPRKDEKKLNEVSIERVR